MGEVFENDIGKGVNIQNTLKHATQCEKKQKTQLKNGQRT